MAHDAFISYASQDKTTADAVCATLEQRGIRCWIAPRDIIPGRAWAESITDAMNDCRVMILVFSSNANESAQISREVNLAANRAIPIVPFRIENVQPSKSLEYFISAAHWLDAVTPTLEKNLQKLAQTVLLLVPEEDRTKERPPTEEQYRTAIQVAWSDQSLSPAKAKSLDRLAEKLGIPPHVKAAIEREVLGTSREDILGRPSPRRAAAAAPAQAPRREESRPEKAHVGFCRKCGNSLLPEAKFCRKCGSPTIA